MADFVVVAKSIRPNPLPVQVGAGNNALGGKLGGFLGRGLGAAAGVAGAAASRALGNIPGASSVIGGALGALTDWLAGEPEVTPESNIYGGLTLQSYQGSIQAQLGAEVPSRDLAGIHQTFLRKVLQDFVNTPSILPLWVCYFGDVDFVGTVVPEFQAYDVNGYSKPHNVAAQSSLVNTSAKTTIAPNLGPTLAIMFCQGVNLPSDSYSVAREPVAPNAGGYLGGFTASNRYLNEVTISFLENNGSFVDFLLRPWLVYNSYRGIPRSIKTDIFIEQYTRTLPGDPLILRKKFVLHKAFPTQIDGEKLSYKDTTDARQINFAYESYSLEGLMQYDYTNNVVGYTDTATGWAKNKAEQEAKTPLPQDRYPSDVSDKASKEFIFVKNILFDKDDYPIDDHNVRPKTNPFMEGLENAVIGAAFSKLEGIVSNLYSGLLYPPQIKNPTGAQSIQNSKNEVAIQNAKTSDSDAIGVADLQNIANTGNKAPPNDDVITASASKRVSVDSINRTPKPSPDTITYTPYANPVPAYVTNKEDIPSVGNVSTQRVPANKNDIPSTTSIRNESIAVNKRDNPGTVTTQPKEVNRRDIPSVNSIPVQIVNPKTADFSSGAVATQSVEVRTNDRVTGDIAYQKVVPNDSDFSRGAITTQSIDIKASDTANGNVKAQRVEPKGNDRVVGNIPYQRIEPKSNDRIAGSIPYQRIEPKSNDRVTGNVKYQKVSPNSNDNIS